MLLSVSYIFTMDAVEKIKLLVADDHPAFREGLCRLLEDEDDLEVVAKAVDGEEAIELANKVQPGVAIIDIAMPKLNGIEAAKQIKAACPTTSIIIVSAYNYERYILDSLRAGAAGYLLKSVRGRELIDAIRAVHAGESVLHPAVARRVIEQLTTVTSGTPRTRVIEPLSEREVEVLKLAAKGISNRDIAEELSLSPRTVQAHLGNIFNKLDVASRTEAVLYGLKRGWLTLEDLP